MSEWQTCAVPDSFVKNKVGRQNQIPAKDIAEVGRFPVVDQGQKFIAGYCDDESKVIDFDLPLIIFGDHTRCFKYVDFPFVLGADGTKVLLPNKKLYDARFYYFALLALEIPSRGYNRHFTILSERRLPLPPLPEQKKIAHILSTVQRAIEAQERIIQTTTELKKALMHKLFTEGLRNEPQKQTDIGAVPESWGVVPLSDVCRFQSGGTPSKKNPEFWKGTIPWVSPKDMKRPRLDDVADHISKEALESGSKLAPAGSVFVVVRGMILAKTVPVALAEVPMAINQDMKAIIPGLKLRSDFLLYALETLRENLFKKVGRSGHGTCTLMGHEVAAFKIPLPDLATQAEIASAIQNLERKKEIHEQKQIQLQDLSRSLLHDLMTAKTRVHELEISA
ncbi:restriction endonuclease subunit S [Denitromonas halophila]|uniref:Restriction endonuclease subunit S n=1 Tax=Denitromonas halophila TaxID=1629404 RepID=A0A557QDD3_9RHOO|nr:restriction endonuclease subunit S [Denitromonas halophila]TVO50928.1 restriction endonuclease subunit S [Denitromonas halophila]